MGTHEQRSLGFRFTDSSMDIGISSKKYHSQAAQWLVAPELTIFFHVQGAIVYGEG